MVKSISEKPKFRILDFLAAALSMQCDVLKEAQTARFAAYDQADTSPTVQLSKKQMKALIAAVDRAMVGLEMLNESLGGLPSDAGADDIARAIVQDGIPLEAYTHVRECAMYWREQAHAYREKYRIAKENAAQLADTLCHNADQEAEMLKFFLTPKPGKNGR